MDQKKSAPDAGVVKPRVLVVDDEQSMRRLLCHTLSLSGFNISTAANAAEFREQVFIQKPEVIILDILLGDHNGPEVYLELLDEGLDSNIPVIFLSALIEKRWMPKSIESNPRHAFISKPFEYQELILKLREFAALK